MLGTKSIKKRFPAEYRAWTAAKDRCYNPNFPGAKRYSGKGITVCDRWLHSFENFIADMGPRPEDKNSLDRIDNDGNYEPSNCRWANSSEQNNNRSSNRIISYNNVSMNIAQWAAAVSISRYTLYNRLHLGWSVEDALTTPVLSKQETIGRMRGGYSMMSIDKIKQTRLKGAQTRKLNAKKRTQEEDSAQSDN
jgi:hypothetical protein